MSDSFATENERLLDVIVKLEAENNRLKEEMERLKEVVELFRKTLAEVAIMANKSDQERIFEKCRDVLRDIYLEEKFTEAFDRILHHAATPEKGGEEQVRWE